MSVSRPIPPDAARRPRPASAVLTAVLHLLALWPYAISGLVAPGWGVAVLLGIWVLLGVAAAAVYRQWGAVAAVVPLIAVVLWFGLLTLGEAVLGWHG